MEASSQSPHLGHWIKVLDHAWTIRSNRMLKSFGLTRGSWYLLYHVNEVGQISQKALQDLLEVESGSMAILVDSLVRKGWLDRIADEKDRRANYLRLTPKGAARWKKVPNFIHALQKEMMGGITREEEANAVTVLKKAWRNLSEEELAKD